MEAGLGCVAWYWVRVCVAVPQRREKVLARRLITTTRLVLVPLRPAQQRAATKGAAQSTTQPDAATQSKASATKRTSHSSFVLTM
jgi:hypothetical protein